MARRWNLEKADSKALYGILLASLFLVVVLIGAIAWLGQRLDAKATNTENYSEVLNERFAEAPPVEYKGTLYRPYEQLTSILIIGVDRYSSSVYQGVSYRNGGQADFLRLMVINEETETITPIQIDRDTMAKITILGVLGDPTGIRTVQICLSHGFGDGKEQSNLLTAQAVSWLLRDIQVDYYISMDMDGITALNDVIGGVTVTLEDDFTPLDPTMVKGETLTLSGMQAEYYVRGRMNIGIGTNQARMARQQVFMDALRGTIAQRIEDNGSAGFINNMLDVLDPYLLTDMKRGRIINTAWNTRKYKQLDVVRIQGETKTGTYGFNEFHVDEAALEDLVMQVFYYPVEAQPES